MLEGVRERGGRKGVRGGYDKVKKRVGGGGGGVKFYKTVMGSVNRRLISEQTDGQREAIKETAIIIRQPNADID